MPSFFSSYQPRPPHTPAESDQQLSSQQSQLRIASLIAELKNPDSQERRVAAIALGRIGLDARAAVPALAAALKDSVWEVRDQAASALGKIGPDAVPELVTALKNSDSNVRITAALALGQIGPDAVSALATALKDSDRGVRYYAALALGAIGPDAGDAVPALTALISDPNVDVRESAATAIKKITPGKVAEQQLATDKQGNTAHQPAPSEPTVGRDVPPITHAELDRQARAIAVTTLGITWGSTVAGFAIGASFSPGAGAVGLVLGSFTGIAVAVAYLRKAS
jgi:hypothetical protein